ncbi:MAG TPA: hypothetical protein PLN44_10550 [Syntrophales bacterium]|nr:hypothetical protein [Syntrophales bacterium]
MSEGDIDQNDDGKRQVADDFPSRRRLLMAEEAVIEKKQRDLHEGELLGEQRKGKGKEADGEGQGKPLFPPNHIGKKRHKGEEGNKEVVPGDDNGNGLGLCRMNGKKEDGPEGALLETETPPQPLVEDQTGQEVKQNVGGAESRGLHPPQAVIQVISNVQKRAVITRVKGRFILRIDDAVFLG